jgi:molybdate transport system permease protein
LIASALALSVTVALAASVIVTVAGTFTGRALARRAFPGREAVEAILSLPLVLPPTVTGYLLLVALGRQGLLGGPIHRLTGVAIPFTWLACVAAAAVMAFPLMHRAARVAFEELDPRHALAAASLGASRLRSFFAIELPLARRGLAAGIALSFARALGEFGATLMLAGNIPGRTQTLPLAVYEASLTGEGRAALTLCALLTAVSVAVLLAVARLVRPR